MEKVFEKPKFAATMMAAVPYRDMERAGDVILKNFPEAPCLPVMTRGIKWMLEGIPCVVIDRENRRILLDLFPERESELLEFYDRYIEEDLDYFATTPETAPFFYGMLERLKRSRPPELKWVIITAMNEGFVGLTCLTWIHCCANIDWSLLTDSTVDVINFDAYQHSDKAALYAGEFKRFLERGGMIGWGIVPVIDVLLSGETVSGLVDRLQEGIDLFVSKGIDEELLASSSWVLPSCETVLLTNEQSDVALNMTKEISEVMRGRYGWT